MTAAGLPWTLFGIHANDGVPDSDGCTWTVASSEGWDAPDQRTQFSSPTAQHGQVGSNQFADGRPVVIKGLIFAPTEEAAWAAYDRATSSMPGIMGEGVIAAYEPVPKQLTVVQAGPPRVSKPTGFPDSPQRQLSYWLTLMAEYPWKRALEAEDAIEIPAGDSATFTGGGTFPADVLVTTTSSGTVELAGGGLTLRASTVPSGTVFDSMPNAYSVTGPGGEDLFSALVPGYQWPAVVPASNTFFNSGTADLALTRYLTFA